MIVGVWISNPFVLWYSKPKCPRLALANLRDAGWVCFTCNLVTLSHEISKSWFHQKCHKKLPSISDSNWPWCIQLTGMWPCWRISSNCGCVTSKSATFGTTGGRCFLGIGISLPRKVPQWVLWWVGLTTQNTAGVREDIVRTTPFHRWNVRFSCCKGYALIFSAKKRQVRSTFA